VQPCNALVSFIIKATVSAPCEPCMFVDQMYYIVAVMFM